MPQRATSKIERAGVGLAATGILVHVLIGVVDEHRVVLHPVGHLTIFLVPLWALTAGVGVLGLLTARGKSPASLLVLLIAGVGTLLLYTA